MSAALLATVLAASLAGSLHCAGMCGGFVAFYAGGEHGPRRYLAHSAYNGGRLVSYLLLGAVAGSLGAAVDLAGSLAGVRQLAALAAGGLMVGWGGYTLLQALDLPLPRVPLPRWLRRINAEVCGAIRGRPPIVRALLLGLVSTLLPCGWLYAFAVIAAGTGSVWRGMLVMAAFWGGTVPLMLGLGLSLQLLSAPLRRRLPALTAAMLIVVGLLWLAGRTALPPHPTHRHAPPAGLAAAESDSASDDGHDRH